MEDQDQASSSEALDATLIQLGGVLLGERAPDDVSDLVARCTRERVGGAESVSITRAGDGTPYTSSSTSALALELDEAQYRANSGPCVAVARGERAQVNASIDSVEGEWPELSAAARQRGVLSVMSTPLEVRDRTLGAINVYGTSPAPFPDPDAVIAQRMAAQGAAVLANVIAFTGVETLNGQLSEALETRDIIGQAKGILMERQACTADHAFDMLRRASQRTNQKLRDIAFELVDAVEQRG